MNITDSRTSEQMCGIAGTRLEEEQRFHSVKVMNNADNAGEKVVMIIQCVEQLLYELNDAKEEQTKNVVIAHATGCRNCVIPAQWTSIIDLDATLIDALDTMMLMGI
eukprot:231320_1